MLLKALLVALGTFLLLVATAVFHAVRRVREAVRRQRETFEKMRSQAAEHERIRQRGEAVVARMDQVVRDWEASRNQLP